MYIDVCYVCYLLCDDGSQLSGGSRCEQTIVDEAEGGGSWQDGAVVPLHVVAHFFDGVKGCLLDGHGCGQEVPAHIIAVGHSVRASVANNVVIHAQSLGEQ